MSIITNHALLCLWQDAQDHPEWATTRLWEHIFNRIVFSTEPWLVSSQQPPTHTPGDLRRVDLVVEQVDSASKTTMTLLFVEAKRASALPNDIAEVETQAYTAACAYAVDSGSTDPIWAMTCVGSLARLWIFDWDQYFLVPYFPGTYGVANRSEYIEISQQGVRLLEHLNYIKKHPKPPRHLIGKASPRPMNATLPTNWHNDEVVWRDAQHEREGHESSSAGWPTGWPTASGTGEVEMTDDPHGESTYVPPLSGTWHIAPGTSTAGVHEEETTDPSQQEVDLSANRHQPHTTDFEEMPPPSEERGEEAYGLASTEVTYNEDGGLEAHQSVQLWSKVDVRRRPHLTRRDEYIFTTDGGVERSTDKDDWKKTQYKKKRAWYYRDGEVFYYTREKLGG